MGFPFAEYSIALISFFALTRFVTEKMKIHLRFGNFWIHHWIIGAVVMGVLYALNIDYPWVWGALTGVCLEGLRRKNWSIRDVDK